MIVKEYFDVMPALYEAFPHLEKSLVKYIIKTGFYVMGRMLRKGCDISVGTRKTGCVLVSASSRRKKQLKRIFRNNLLYKQKKKVFKNEYYFSISDENDGRLTEKNGKFILKNVYCSKEILSVSHRSTKKIYALELTDVGMDFFIDELETDRVRLVKRLNSKNVLIKV